MGSKNSKIKKYLFKNNSEFISLINILLKAFDKKINEHKAICKCLTFSQNYNYFILVQRLTKDLTPSKPKVDPNKPKADPTRAQADTNIEKEDPD